MSGTRDHRAECAFWEDSARLGSAQHDGLSARTRQWGLTIQQNALRNLGQLALLDHDHAAARAFHERGLQLARELENELRVLFALLGVADVAIQQHDLVVARPLYREVLHVARQLDHWWAATSSIKRLAGIAAAEGRPVKATRLHAAALGLDRPSWLGKLVDIGVPRLYARCEYPSGEEATGLTKGRGGSIPTVVLESGLGDSWGQWQRVLPLIAAFAPVVAYSRAGLPPSDPGPLPRTSRLIADDLHALLSELADDGFGPPYVLVGHSFGCLPVQYYVIQYRDEVAGLVLLDGTHEDSLEEGERRNAQLPPERRDAGTRWFAGGNPSEHVDLGESMRQLRDAGPLPPVPIVHIRSMWIGSNYQPEQTAQHAQRARDLREEEAKAIRRYGADVRFVVADRSGHYIHVDQPALVADTVRAVVESLRGVVA
ncbi:MAG: alpha/beta fold hydrolase [Chloroflexi bacterium]|nr:alpha/beta fold hydrolase [Chloroflexota bacterium]